MTPVKLSMVSTFLGGSEDTFVPNVAALVNDEVFGGEDGVVVGPGQKQNSPAVKFYEVTNFLTIEQKSPPS